MVTPSTVADAVPASSVTATFAALAAASAALRICPVALPVCAVAPHTYPFAAPIFARAQRAPHHC